MPAIFFFLFFFLYLFFLLSSVPQRVLRASPFYPLFFFAFFSTLPASFFPLPDTLAVQSLSSTSLPTLDSGLVLSYFELPLVSNHAVTKARPLPSVGRFVRPFRRSTRTHGGHAPLHKRTAARRSVGRRPIGRSTVRHVRFPVDDSATQLPPLPPREKDRARARERLPETQTRRKPESSDSNSKTRARARGGRM